MSFYGVRLLACLHFLFLLTLYNIWEYKYSLICSTFTGTLNQLHFIILFIFHLVTADRISGFQFTLRVTFRIAISNAIIIIIYFIFQFLHVVLMEYACLTVKRRQLKGTLAWNSATIFVTITLLNFLQHISSDKSHIFEVKLSNIETSFSITRM